MQRRGVLKISAVAAYTISGMPGFLARAAAQAGGDKTLVVIQLMGSNDGLNTLVPYQPCLIRGPAQHCHSQK